VLALTVLIASLKAQQNQSRSPQELVLRAGTEEVLLDFIVRDKHQKLVEDLKPEDIRIFEDGVLQRPRSFIFRSGTEPAATHTMADSNALLQGPSDPLRQINLVTIVFESMSPLSRRTAVERAHEFLKAEAGPNTWMAVYSLRYQLSVQQTYTTDIALVHKAIDHAGTGAYQEFAKENLNIIQRINSLQANGLASATFQPLEQGSAEERGPQNDKALASSEVQMQQLVLRTLFRQEGMRSIDALRKLVREQTRLPGRKTVLFFSEGLVVPADQPEQLESVIAEANRGNVAFYTVDARGLGMVSNLRLSQDTAQALDGTEHNSVGIGGNGDYMGQANSQTDLQANARRLAQGTGGFAMDNSNDLRGSLGRVMEEIRSYYEVTYTPSSNSFDGHFRKLEVKLDRPGLKVQSRAGYYALPLVNGETIAPYELAALNAINMEHPPRSFPYTAAALRFGEDNSGVDYLIVFSVPANSLHFTHDPTNTSFRIRISVLGLVKDERGQIVARVGKDLPFSAPLVKQANFALGTVTITLPLRLPPGRYQLQTAVIDREADLASVKRSVLIVPHYDSRSTDVSDLVWVRSVDSSQSPEPGNSLDTPQGRITPELEPALTRNDSAKFYFIAFSLAASKDQPQAKITIAQDGMALATLPLANPQPDTNGAYRYLGSVPLNHFQPGQYEITVTVAQGNEQGRSHATFDVH